MEQMACNKMKRMQLSLLHTLWNDKNFNINLKRNFCKLNEIYKISYQFVLHLLLRTSGHVKFIWEVTFLYISCACRLIK